MKLNLKRITLNRTMLIAFITIIVSIDILTSFFSKILDFIDDRKVNFMPCIIETFILFIFLYLFA